MAADGKLHPIQEAFWNEHGLQCGFCTPGMIMTTKQIAGPQPQPDAMRRSGMAWKAICAAAPDISTS